MYSFVTGAVLFNLPVFQEKRATCQIVPMLANREEIAKSSVNLNTSKFKVKLCARVKFKQNLFIEQYVLQCQLKAKCETRVKMHKRWYSTTIFLHACKIFKYRWSSIQCSDTFHSIALIFEAPLYSKDYVNKTLVEPLQCGIWRRNGCVCCLAAIIDFESPTL